MAAKAKGGMEVMKNRVITHSGLRRILWRVVGVVLGGSQVDFIRARGPPRGVEGSQASFRIRQSTLLFNSGPQ